MKKVLDRLLELKGTQSTAAFARSIGIPQQTMDRYLKGREPTIEVIKQLCLVYGVSSDWLLCCPDKETSSSSTEPRVSDHDVNAHVAVHKRVTSEAGSLPECLDCKYKRLADAFKSL